MRLPYSIDIRGEATKALLVADFECELHISRDRGEFSIDGVYSNGKSLLTGDMLEQWVGKRILDRAEDDLATYGSRLRRSVEEAWSYEREAS